MKKKITTDLNGNEFTADKINHVMAEIISKIKNPNGNQLSNLGIHICDGTITTDRNGKSIPKNKKYEIGTTYLRKANTKEAYFKIASLILENKIQHDEDNIQIHPNNKFNIAARNFRKSGLPEAMVDLSKLIYNGHITEDENGKIILEEEKYNIIERIIRKNIDIPYAKTLLANLIIFKKANRNEFNQIILENERYETASRLYIESPNEDSYNMVAYLIMNNHIDSKEGLKILGNSQQNLSSRHEIIAELCRHSKSSWTLHVLGMYVYNELTNKDEYNNEIDEEQRISKSFDILQKSSEPDALYDLILLKLHHTPKKSTEILESALSSIEKAILQGCSKPKTTELYCFLSEQLTLTSNLEKEQYENKNDDDSENSFPTETIDENNTKNFSDSEEKLHKRNSINSNNNNNEENILNLEERKKLKALKKTNKEKKSIYRTKKREIRAI